MPEAGVSQGVVAKRRVKRGVMARGAEYDHEYLGKVLSGFDVILERVISEQFGGNGTEDDDDKGLLMNNGVSDVASATTKVEGEVTPERKEAEGSRRTGKERRESEVGDAVKMAGNRGNVRDDDHDASSGGFGLDSERVVQSKATQAFNGERSTSKTSAQRLKVGKQLLTSLLTMKWARQCMFVAARLTFSTRVAKYFMETLATEFCTQMFQSCLLNSRKYRPPPARVFLSRM